MNVLRTVLIRSCNPLSLRCWVLCGPRVGLSMMIGVSPRYKQRYQHDLSLDNRTMLTDLLPAACHVLRRTPRVIVVTLFNHSRLRFALGRRLSMFHVVVFVRTIIVFRCFLFTSRLIRIIYVFRWFIFASLLIRIIIAFRCFLFTSLLIRIIFVFRCFLFTSLLIKIIRDCSFEPIIIMNLRFYHSDLVIDKVY